mgnify:CR=1 FL=1
MVHADGCRNGDGYRNTSDLGMGGNRGTAGRGTPVRNVDRVPGPAARGGDGEGGRDGRGYLFGSMLPPEWWLAVDVGDYINFLSV